MPKNLWKALAADRVDHGELQQVIQRHFSSSSQPGVREITYPGEDCYALKLIFNKEDRLTRLEAGPAFTTELEQKLQRAIDAALLTAAPGRVCRNVLFANFKLTGSWRYHDWFQLTPVPATAPQLNCLVGDHPFVLEVRVPGSPDPLITSYRAGLACHEVAMIVTGFVESSIRGLATRPFYGFWTRLPDKEIAYLYPEYPAVVEGWADAFSVPGDPALVVSSRDLFGLFGRNAGAPLSIPAELEETLDRFQSLDRERKNQTLRACYWIHRASASFLESFAQSFLAVITAAETLMRADDVKVCGDCGQLRYGLRRSFAAFLDRVAPLDELTPLRAGDRRRFRERLKDLNDARSKMAHGGDLSARDGFGNAFAPSWSHEDSDLRVLLRVMPLVLSAWVRSQPDTVTLSQTWPNLERVLRWIAARAGRLHQSLLGLCEKLGPKTSKTGNRHG
jgi:hypothetical protein